jgi:hypothetical protein
MALTQYALIALELFREFYKWISARYRRVCAKGGRDIPVSPLSNELVWAFSWISLEGERFYQVNIIHMFGN